MHVDDRELSEGNTDAPVVSEIKQEKFGCYFL